MPVGLGVHFMLCSEQTRQTCCLLCWEWKWNYSRLSATNAMVLNALPWHEKSSLVSQELQDTYTLAHHTMLELSHVHRKFFEAISVVMVEK